MIIVPSLIERTCFLVFNNCGLGCVCEEYARVSAKFQLYTPGLPPPGWRPVSQDISRDAGVIFF